MPKLRRPAGSSQGGQWAPNPTADTLQLNSPMRLETLSDIEPVEQKPKWTTRVANRVRNTTVAKQMMLISTGMTAVVTAMGGSVFAILGSLPAEPGTNLAAATFPSIAGGYGWSALIGAGVGAFAMVLAIPHIIADRDETRDRAYKLLKDAPDTSLNEAMYIAHRAPIKHVRRVIAARESEISED